MPGVYAHLRFGHQVLGEKKPDFGRLYEVGLQGPDFFFYYNPIVKTTIGAMGSSVHRQTGREFFDRAVRQLRSTDGKDYRDYVFGLLGHYCLDSQCHPVVCEIAAEGDIGHSELEVEFDRFLMARDGIPKPHRKSPGHRFHVTAGQSRWIAGLYPGTRGVHIRTGIRHMRIVNRFMAAPCRRTVRLIMGLGGSNGTQMVMTETENTHCSHLNPLLLSHYEKALQRYPALAEQLEWAIRTGKPLNREFDPIFG